jgi:hypothetical protein
VNLETPQLSETAPASRKGAVEAIINLLAGVDLVGWLNILYRLLWHATKRKQRLSEVFVPGLSDREAVDATHLTDSKTQSHARI